MSVVTKDEINEDGYRHVYDYDEDRLLRRRSYDPEGLLFSDVKYEWDLGLSSRLPARWTVYGRGGKLENKFTTTEWDSTGGPLTVVMYDADGNEVHRVNPQERNRR